MWHRSYAHCGGRRTSVVCFNDSATRDTTPMPGSTAGLWMCVRLGRAHSIETGASVENPVDRLDGMAHCHVETMRYEALNMGQVFDFGKARLAKSQDTSRWETCVAHHLCNAGLLEEDALELAQVMRVRLQMRGAPYDVAQLVLRQMGWITDDPFD